MTALFPAFSSNSFGMGPAPSPIPSIPISSPSPSPSPSPSASSPSPPPPSVPIPTSTTPPPTTSPMSYTRICIRELDINVREQDIQRYFELTLTVMSRDIEIIKQANKTKCYAFVSIPSSELNRLLAMNNTIIPFFNPSKPVLISLAKERKASVVQGCSPSLNALMNAHATPPSPSLNATHTTSPQHYPHGRKLSMGIPPLQHFPGAAMQQHINGTQTARDSTLNMTSPRVQSNSYEGRDRGASAPNSARSYASSPYMSFAVSPSISGNASPPEPTSPPSEQPQESQHVPLFDRKASFLRSQQRQPPFKQKLADLPSTPNTPQPTPNPNNYQALSQSFSNMQLPSPALQAAAAPIQQNGGHSSNHSSNQSNNQQQQQQQQHQQNQQNFMPRGNMMNGTPPHNTPPHNNNYSHGKPRSQSQVSPSMHPYRSPPFMSDNNNNNNNNNFNNQGSGNNQGNNNNNNNNNNFLLHNNQQHNNQQHNNQNNHHTYPGQHHGNYNNHGKHHNNHHNNHQIEMLLKENAQLKYQQHEMNRAMEMAQEREREMQITVTALHTQLAEQLMRVRDMEEKMGAMKTNHELAMKSLISQLNRDGISTTSIVSLTSFSAATLSSPTPSTHSSSSLSSPSQDMDKEVQDAKPTNATSPSSAFPSLTSSIPIRRFSQPPLPIPMHDDWVRSLSNSSSTTTSTSSPKQTPVNPPTEDEDITRFISHNAMMESFVHDLTGHDATTA